MGKRRAVRLFLIELFHTKVVDAGLAEGVGEGAGENDLLVTFGRVIIVEGVSSLFRLPGQRKSKKERKKKKAARSVVSRVISASRNPSHFFIVFALSVS